MARTARTRISAALVVALVHLAVLVGFYRAGPEPAHERHRSYSVWLRVDDHGLRIADVLTDAPEQRNSPAPIRPVHTAAVVNPLGPSAMPTGVADVRSERLRSLDLRVPPALLEAPEAQRADGPGWVFDRKLARRLAAAKADAATRRSLADRQAARVGLGSADYARRSALGEKLKTDAGCFELREDPDNGGTRWWREACSDTTQSEWEQEPLPELPEGGAAPK